MPKQYLDDNGNPIAAPAKQYLDDDGNPISGSEQQSADSAPAHFRVSDPNAAHIGVGPRNPDLPEEGSIHQRYGPGAQAYVENARAHVADWMEKNAPLVFGTVGGLAGGPVGAAAGGLAGGVAQHPPDPNASSSENIRKTGIPAVEEGATQALYEVGGKYLSKGAGKLLAPLGKKLTPMLGEYLAKYPFLKGMLGIAEHETSPKAQQFLTRAAASKEGAGEVVEEIGHALSDIEQEMAKAPPEGRTVRGFLNAVNSSKSAMNQEYEKALSPISGVNIMPAGISQRIRSLIRPYMHKTAEGKAEMEIIESAAKNFEKPWTFGELDALRTDLGATLSKHGSKGSVARYVAEKGDLSLAIDTAVRDGLRDTVYPAADLAAGKTAGYFEQMKSRQLSLIRLQKVLDERVKKLSGAQAVSEATSRFSPENVSIYLHPTGEPRGYLHGLTKTVMPPREMTQASKMVKKAFPRVIDSQPYQVLFGTTGRVFGPAPRSGNPTDEWADPSNRP